MDQKADQDATLYPDDEETVSKIIALAERLPGLSLERLGYAPKETEHDERSRAKAQATALAGVISWAYDSVLDELFQDFAILLAGGTVSDTIQIRDLPAMYTDRYGIVFVQKFVVVAVDLGTAMVSGFGYPTCVAQELVLRLVLNRAEQVEWTYPLNLADGWRSDLDDALFEDGDHELLYGLWGDGLGNAIASAGQLDVANLDFADWFSSFTDHQHVNPYCLD